MGHPSPTSTALCRGRWLCPKQRRTRQAQDSGAAVWGERCRELCDGRSKGQEGLEESLQQGLGRGKRALEALAVGGNFERGASQNRGVSQEEEEQRCEGHGTAHGYWLCSEARCLLHRWYLHLRAMMLSPVCHLLTCGTAGKCREIRK